MASRTIKEELLVSGLQDWSYAAWVLGIVMECGGTDPSNRRTLAIGLIAEVITERLAVPGDVVDGKHRPWACSPGEAIERITREWLVDWGDEMPTPGAIVWLDNTPTGDAIAHAVLQREERLGS